MTPYTDHVLLSLLGAMRDERGRTAMRWNPGLAAARATQRAALATERERPLRKRGGGRARQGSGRMTA